MRFPKRMTATSTATVASHSLLCLIFCLGVLIVSVGTCNAFNTPTQTSLSRVSSFIGLNHGATRIQTLKTQYKNIQNTANTASSLAHRNSLLRMSSKSSPPPYPIRIAVMGGGNFGLALATVVANKNIPTTLLIRDEETAKCINTTHQHPRYMKGVEFPHMVRATSDPETALSDATYIIHAVPCQYSRSFLEKVKDYIPAGVPVLSASKGIETTSLGFMADILKDCLGEDRSYAFLSGPSFAREICEGVATAVVIASEDLMLADDLADLMSSENFRVFTSKDVMGVEIGGAVKNVIALAAGMCEGLGLGTNAMSGLVTRGCAEMRRLGLTLGARPSTIAGLSG
jgi:glycerol-3-phosphate dehydrogenase (NAD+)